jgi:hypothetical protein
MNVTKRPFTWAEVDRMLREGEVAGIPAGTDLAQFLWDHCPESRADLEAEYPGRVFRQAK